MTYIGPTGTLAGGFQYKEGIEIALTSSGGEATVTYTGPYANAGIFLDSIFGLWGYSACGASNLSKPLPLPTQTTKFGAGVRVDSDQFSLFADTYRLRISGDPTPIGPTLSDLGTGPIQQANMFTSPAAGSWTTLNTFSGCDVDIVVAYRHKNLESWPDPYRKLGDGTAPCLCNGGDIPAASALSVIPNPNPGTFLEILEQDGRIEYQTIPSRNLAYIPGNTGESGHTIDWINNRKKDTSPSGTKVNLPQLPEDVDAVVPIQTHRLSVLWSNVPRFQPQLRNYLGKVNSKQFLDFPPRSAYVNAITPRYRGRGTSSREILEIQFDFIIKTVDVEPRTGAANANDLVEEHFGIVCEKMGVWGRSWSDVRLGWSPNDPFDENDTIFQTNWVDVGGQGDLFSAIDFKDMFTVAP